MLEQSKKKMTFKTNQEKINMMSADSSFKSRHITPLPLGKDH